MSALLWFQNLVVYSLQVALMAAAGLLLPRLLRLRRPRVLYHYGQALLAVCLLLPLVEPWRHFEVASSTTAASRILFQPEVTLTRLATFPVAGLILLVLAGGVALRLTWLAAGVAQLNRYRRTARRIDALPQRIHDIAVRLGAAPEFCLSEKVQSPATFGLRRPIILLPARFMELDADRQQAISCHELLHIVGRHWVVNLIEECVLAAFWFHPVVGWLVGRIRLSREQMVDRDVVELLGARKAYLYALVEIAAGADVARAVMAPAFLKECQLAERIRALVKEDFMSKRRIIISLALIVVATIIAGLVIVHKFPLRTAGGAAAGSNPMMAGGTSLSAFNSLPDGTKVLALGNGVSAPVPIYKPEPSYTPAARAAKLQGTAVLWTIIGADGAVKNVTVTKSLDPGLDQSAVDTVKSWKFRPAMKSDQPVACKVMVEVSFRLF